MALAQHRLWAWIWQATAADKRVGLVEMTKADYDAAAAEGRAQDPRVGSLHLKHITRTLYTPPEPEGQAAAPARRRRSTPAAEA